ncbi:MAG: Tetratricopeptide repeat, partial [Abditibacteriota bacterium]|nr:Tetratricopeptide repeat [Abditibacteriota bacterium]
LAGRAEWQAGNSQKAGALFKAALLAESTNVEARYWTGELLFQRGRKEMAEELLLDATRLAPNRGDIWTRLAQFALQTLDYKTALERLEKAEKLTPTGEVAWLRASALHSLGRLPEAEAAARQAVARDPKPKAYVLLAEIVQSSPEEDKQREAQTYLHKTLEEVPNASNALKLLAINHRALGEHQQAVKVLRRLLRLLPSQSEAYLMLSQSYQALGKPDLAARTTRIFRRLEPLQTKVDFARHRLSIEHGSLSAELQYIRALLALGRHDLSAEVINRALAKNPDHAELQALSRRAAEPPTIKIESLPADPAGDAP